MTNSDKDAAFLMASCVLALLAVFVFTSGILGTFFVVAWGATLGMSIYYCGRDAQERIDAARELAEYSQQVRKLNDDTHQS